jgi:hypothetical protein
MSLRIPVTYNWHGGLFQPRAHAQSMRYQDEAQRACSLYRLIDHSHYERMEVFFSEFMEFEQGPWQEKKISLI